MEFKELAKLAEQLVQIAQVSHERGQGVLGDDLKKEMALLLAKNFNVTPTHSYAVSFKFTTLEDKQATQYRITKLLGSLAESTNEAVGSVTITQEL